MADPFLPMDDFARDTVSGLLGAMRFAAIAFEDPQTRTPSISRIAALMVPRLGVVTLVSELSHHTAALAARPDCALLVGEAPGKGDALTGPRLTLHARALPLDKGLIRARWIAALPKSALYFQFADFIALQLVPQDSFLNGGFGKAYRIAAEEISALYVS